MKLERVIQLIQFRRRELAELLRLANTESESFKHSQELIEKVYLLVKVQTDYINEIERELVALRLKNKYRKKVV